MKIKRISDNVIKQVFLILLILLVGFLIVYNLKYFIPGALGALTLYIIFRNTYFKLTEERNWKPVWASTFLIVVTLVCVVIPVWVIVEIMIPQVNNLLANRQVIVEKFNAVKAFMESRPILNRINLSEENLMSQLQKVTTYIPRLFNSVAELLANIATALFILYFMLVNARNMERIATVYLPFNDENKDYLWEETNMMVRANALGIPILAICQGIVAVIGYWIFGVNNPFLWGMLTGVASIIPVLGTMIVWIPICIIQIATGDVTNGIILTLYCLIIVGGIDNVLRFTILKKLGNVHPLITVFGVLLGLNLFGMMGLIFGPLLLSYFSVLIKVYRTEFGKKKMLMAAIEERKEEEAMEEKAEEEVEEKMEKDPAKPDPVDKDGDK